MENPIKMDDLEIPLFLETPLSPPTKYPQTANNDPLFLIAQSGSKGISSTEWYEKKRHLKLESRPRNYLSTIEQGTMDTKIHTP